MSAIKIENLTFSYYGYVKPVFENVSFLFDTNWKTGLIGRNGIGKSTLIKILLGLNHEYTGDVKLASNLKISYIPQDIFNLTGSLNE